MLFKKIITSRNFVKKGLLALSNWKCLQINENIQSMPSNQKEITWNQLPTNQPYVLEIIITKFLFYLTIDILDSWTNSKESVNQRNKKGFFAENQEKIYFSINFYWTTCGSASVVTSFIGAQNACDLNDIICFRICED